MKRYNLRIQCVFNVSHICAPSNKVRNCTLRNSRKLQRSSKSEKDESEIQLRNSRGKSKICSHRWQAGRQISVCASKRKLDILERKARRRANYAIIQPNLYKQQFGLLRSGTDVRSSYSHILRPPSLLHRKERKKSRD